MSNKQFIGEENSRIKIKGYNKINNIVQKNALLGNKRKRNIDKINDNLSRAILLNPSSSIELSNMKSINTEEYTIINQNKENNRNKNRLCNSCFLPLYKKKTKKNYYLTCGHAYHITCLILLYIKYYKNYNRKFLMFANCRNLLSNKEYDKIVNESIYKAHSYHKNIEFFDANRIESDIIDNIIYIVYYLIDWNMKKYNSLNNIHYNHDLDFVDLIEKRNIFLDLDEEAVQTNYGVEGTYKNSNLNDSNTNIIEDNKNISSKIEFNINTKIDINNNRKDTNDKKDKFIMLSNINIKNALYDQINMNQGLFKPIFPVKSALSSSLKTNNASNVKSKNEIANLNNYNDQLDILHFQCVCCRETDYSVFAILDNYFQIIRKNTLSEIESNIFNDITFKYYIANIEDNIALFCFLILISYNILIFTLLLLRFTYRL